MKTPVLFPAAILALVVGVSGVRADPPVGSSPDVGWQPFPLTHNDYTDPNRPHWDQASDEGDKNNIGNEFGGLPESKPPWWGQAGPMSSNADLNFYFEHPRRNAMTELELRTEITGNADVNSFGWYNVDDPTEMHEIWAGTDSPLNNAGASFLPTEKYGFYLMGSIGVYYTESKLNSLTEQSHQHFSMFALSLEPFAETWVIGVEDLDMNALPNEPLGDFQDFVIRVYGIPFEPPPAEDSAMFRSDAMFATSAMMFGSTLAVPEPSSLCVVVAAAGLLLRRRRGNFRKGERP